MKTSNCNMFCLFRQHLYATMAMASLRHAMSQHASKQWMYTTLSHTHTTRPWCWTHLGSAPPPAGWSTWTPASTTTRVLGPTRHSLGPASLLDEGRLGRLFHLGVLLISLLVGLHLAISSWLWLSEVTTVSTIFLPSCWLIRQKKWMSMNDVSIVYSITVYLGS